MRYFFKKHHIPNIIFANSNKNTFVKTRAKRVLTNFILLTLCLTTVLFIFTGCAGRRRVKLKYAWGTTAAEIKANEIVTYVSTFKNHTTNKEKHYFACEDIRGEVDGLTELHAGDTVCYWTDYDGKLYRISRDTDSDLSLTETLDILKDHYGDHYYTDTVGRTDARLHHYYWWNGDTLLEYYNNHLDYYNTNNELTHISSEIKAFFNKE